MEAQGYDKLVEALRDIEKTMFALGTSPINMDNVSIRLAYDKRWGPTANDAADAIEALQAEVDEAKQYNTDLLNMKEMTKEEEDEILESLRNAPVGPIEPMLIEQLPKHGEWIHIEGDDPWEWTCSVCMKKSEIHGEEPAFCPKCGADMRKMEVQE